MKRRFFKVLNTINKAILPKYSKKDALKLTKFERAVVGYKYFVLINSLE
jgi:hypothetical protein